MMKIWHFGGKTDRLATVHTETNCFQLFAPCTPLIPKPTTKGHGRAGSDRKQSKEEQKLSISDGDRALLGSPLHPTDTQTNH